MSTDNTERLASVLATYITTGIKNHARLPDYTSRSFSVATNPEADGSPIGEDGIAVDENGLELNFNGACPYRHVRRQETSEGVVYIPLLYCPVAHPERQDIEAAKQLIDSSTTSNMFIRGGKFEDPRDAAWVAQQISQDPLVSWLEYFDYRIWEAPTPPNWVGNPVADGTTREDYLSQVNQNLKVTITIEKV